MFMLILLATFDKPRSQAKPQRLVPSLLSTFCSETAARTDMWLPIEVRREEGGRSYKIAPERGT